MNAHKIRQMYEVGHITCIGAALYTLQLPIDELEKALDELPQEVKDEMREFISYYTPQTHIFNGDHPSEEAVKVAKEWIKKTPNH